MTDSLAHAVALYKAGRIPEAITMCGRLIKADPHQPDVLNLLGIAFHGIGKSDVALKLLTSAAETAPREPTYLKNLALVQRDTGDTPGAITSLRSALKLDPLNVEMLAVLGELEFANRDFRAALSSTGSALRLAPSDRLSLAVQSLGLRTIMLRDEALRISRYLLKAAPLWERSWLEHGMNLVGVQQLDTATPVLKRAAVLKPSETDAYRMLAMRYIAQLDTVKSSQHMRRAALLKPHDAFIAAGFAEIACARGDVARAVAYAEEALAQNPYDAGLHFRLGVFLLSAGEHGLAQSTAPCSTAYGGSAFPLFGTDGMTSRTKRCLSVPSKASGMRSCSHAAAPTRSLLRSRRSLSATTALSGSSDDRFQGLWSAVTTGEGSMAMTNKPTIGYRMRLNRMSTSSPGGCFPSSTGPRRTPTGAGDPG